MLAFLLEFNKCLSHSLFFFNDQLFINGGEIKLGEINTGEINDEEIKDET